MENKEKSSILIHILTPLIVLIFCIGIFIIAMIKPYDKVKVYANLAFMDDFKTNPENISSGLVIRDKDIETDFSGQTWDSGEFIRPRFGELYAVIKSDAFSVDVPVYWGSDSELFEKGACQAAGSVLLGDNGNSVISAHADTFFAELPKLKEGDTVTINTTYGEFVCTVKELISFKKTNKKYVAASKDTKLTMYTCKKDILGSSDERIGVVCELTEKKFYNQTGGESE